ncbi:MAG: HDOD domain-containing protein [Gemmatimonadetes bacterium]|nr:HDOD domain-containing protein [Gemmatimonadota bacterium]NNL30974.1 HDOD domain-containing protein [Gemmatimonadota bacterium]
MFRWKRSPDPQAELRELIGDYQLPTFSAGAVETLRLLREEADLNQVAERLLTDPGLSVRILKTVNSAAFGMRQQVSNLGHAVSLLGRSRVEALVLTAAVGDTLPTPAGMDVDSFWDTSARRACLARLIAKNRDPSVEMQAFTAGLLQDMAVPVLALAKPDVYPELYRRAATDEGPPLYEVERDALGYDHAQVGAMMAESWDLPEGLITAISDHHLTGERAPAPVEAVAQLRHGASDDALEGLRAHCLQSLGMEEGAIDRIIETAEAEATSLARGMRG